MCVCVLYIHMKFGLLALRKIKNKFALKFKRIWLWYCKNVAGIFKPGSLFLVKFNN